MKQSNAQHPPVHAAVLSLSSSADYFSSGSTYSSYNINGLGGNDQIFVSYGDDTVNGGAGNDLVYSPGGNDKLSGGDGDDTVIDGGNGGKTILNGDGGNDHLVSYGIYYVENGGAGNDTLEGGGRGTMAGGLGVDIFKIINTGPPPEVTIKDFNALIGEKIDVGQLGVWDNNGYHPLTAANVEVQGSDVVIHAGYGDAIVHGVGVQVALVGIANAFIFDDGYPGDRG